MANDVPQHLQPITWHTEALDERFARVMLDDSRSAWEANRYDRTNASWNSRIVQNSAPVLVRDCSEPTSRFVRAMLLSRNVITHDHYHVMAYAWECGSFIPWHNDGHVQTAVTVYLNDRWEDDWGGLFLYKIASTGEVHGHSPRFNCAMRNDANVMHSTTPVTAKALEPRFTLQLFSNRPQASGPPTTPDSRAA
jgi:hypothetical protein